MKNQRTSVPRVLALLLAGAMLLGSGACGKPEPRQETPIDPVTVERAAEPPALQTANEAVCLALRQYIYARLAAETFAQTDFSSLSPAEAGALTEKTALAWEAAAQLTAAAQALAARALLLLETPGPEQTRSAIRPRAEAAVLAARPGKAPTLPLAASAAGDFDPKAWAQSLTEQYDALKGAQRYHQLARQLGTDAKNAYEQMVLAQEIIRNKAASDAAFWDKMTKAAQAVKTASKVGLLGISMAATGGGSVALLEGAGLLVGGVDCIADVAETGSTLILGDGNQVAVAFGEIKEKLGPVSSLVALASLNPSEIGKTAAATTEALVYVADSLVDLFYEDKIVGVRVEGLSGKAVGISAQVFEAGAKAAVEAGGFPYPKTAKTLLELAGLWEPEPALALARMDALAAQMAELARAAGLAEETLEPPPAEIEISGQYTFVVDYTGGATDTETVTIRDQGDGSILWIDSEGDETILSYDKSSRTICFEAGEFELYVALSGSGDAVTGSGYVSGILWELPFEGAVSLTKISG